LEEHISYDCNEKFCLKIFFELSGTPEGKIGTGVMPAVRLAIKHINKNQDVLRGYKLHMYWNDTQVNQSFFHDVCV